MEAQILNNILALLEQFTSQALPLSAQLPSERKLHLHILMAGLLANPAVSQLQPEDLVDAAISFSQLMEERLKTYETPQSQVNVLERLFRQT